MEKNNLPIIVGVTLIILAILFIIGFVTVPRLIYQPSHDFLYTYQPEEYYHRITNDGQEYTYHYFSVHDSRLIKEEKTVTSVRGNRILIELADPQLYYYDVSENRTREISFEEARNLKLDLNEISPDGYSIDRGDTVSGPFFFFNSRSDYNNMYLKGHNTRHRLNLINQGLGSTHGLYNRNLTFLGWIINN